MKPMTILALAVASCLVFAPAGEAQTAAGGGRRTQPSEAPRPTTSPERDRQMPQGFSVVLVLGDLQGGATSDNVPAAARKALADMKDFLPYKSYRLLDVQWTLCCSRTPSTSVVSRLRGADGQEYELSLNTSADTRGRLGVRFQLREPSGQSGHAGPASEVVIQLQREVARLEQELEAATRNAHARAEVGVGRPVDEDRNVQDLRSKLAEMKIRLARSSMDQRTASQGRSVLKSMNPSVIDTSFTMDVGETVVVGTSRVAGGEKALIALLTAVANR